MANKLGASPGASTRPVTQKSGFQKVYNSVGYSKPYNFVLWFIFSGALLGFALARSPYLNFYKYFCSPTAGGLLTAGIGECYAYLNFDRYYVGIRLHLFAVIFAAFLVLFQFVPVIRHKFITFHRLNGYLVIILITLSNVGALMIARETLGGGLATQMWVGCLAILSTIFIILAWVNIKRLQIDQHRAWMLRLWFYYASIITERFIFLAMNKIISDQGGYYMAIPCNKISWLYGPQGDQIVARKYPSCAPYVNGSDPAAQTAVLARLPGTGPETAAALLEVTFGASLWLGLLINAIGIEIYLQLTPGETARLKEVSYQRQLERKYKFPGDAGLTAGRLGDAEHWESRHASVAHDEKEDPESSS